MGYVGYVDFSSWCFFWKYVVGGGDFSLRHRGVLLILFLCGKYVAEFGDFS